MRPQPEPRLEPVPDPTPVPTPVPAPRPRAVPQPPRPVAVTPEPAPELDADATWRALIAELRVQKRELLAGAMAHARVLELAAGRVRLGYAPLDGMYRSQALRMQKEAEAVLGKMLGTPTTLSIEQVGADEAIRSIAEVETERQREREERIQRESRECPAVLAALRIFKGSVERIRVLEEVEDEPAGFVVEAEENEETDA